MPYHEILQALLRAVSGSRAALLLDAQGELVVGAGDLGDHQQLIGAYQGIALGIASRALARFDGGQVDSLACRYENGSVLLTTLRDGYFLVLTLGPRSVLAVARRKSASAREKLNREI